VCELARVRWDNHPELWRDLLIMAGDERAIVAIRRQGKLLFSGEFVSKATQPTRPDTGQ
jgi:hypothetical protein